MKHAWTCLPLIALAACSSDDKHSKSSISNDDDTVQIETHLISGTVSGLYGRGEIFLYNNAADELRVDTDGEFQFEAAVEVGAGYEISVDFSAHYQYCEISSGSGTIAHDDVIDIEVVCNPIGIYEENSQAASTVIGQDSFTEDGTAWLNYPWGNSTYVNGILFIADADNNRILMYDGIPTEPDVEPVGVLGQEDFYHTDVIDVSASTFNSPLEVSTDGQHLVVVDYGNNRILIFNTIPSITGGFVDADVVLGQEGDFETGDSSAGAAGLSEPYGAFIGAGKLLVADSENHRVLVWNTVPTSSDAVPDLVLGQSDFDGVSYDTTESRLRKPTGVWTDGTRIAVADENNSRILIWNDWPTESGAAADVVLGQADMSSDDTGCSATNLDNAVKVTSNGTQLFVSDYFNSRVLIWDEFPTENTAPADRVIGQPDMTSCDGDLTRTTLYYPYGLDLVGTQLIVCDYNNNRYMVYDGQ